MDRRTFLKTTAAVSIGVPITTRPVSAEHSDSGQPDDVTLSFDQSRLGEWQPLLFTSHLDVEPSKQYAWIAESPDHDTTAYTYWTYYVTQSGITSRDSHYLDREPIYVFVDEQTSSISEVVYSGYHWLASRDQSPRIYSDSTGEHPQFRVADKWHHYYQSSDEGVFVDLASMDDVFESWLATGWEDHLHVGAAQNPWLMASVDNGESRPHWWREGSLGISIDAAIVSAWLRVSNLPGVSIRGAETADVRNQ